MGVARNPQTASDERASIVVAAWEVLERSGFEGFKVQLVARTAGVSARAFYRHFADKDALYVALLRDEAARSAAIQRARVAKVSGDDPVAQLWGWIDGVLSAAVDPARMHRARMFSSQPSVMRAFPEVAEAVRSMLVEPLVAIIGRGVAVGVFASNDPERDACLVYSLTGGELQRALRHKVEPAVAEVVDFSLRAFGCVGVADARC